MRGDSVAGCYISKANNCCRLVDKRTNPFYCRSGGRSALAAEALSRLGFASPLSLAGGYQAWMDAGHACDGGARS